MEDDPWADPPSAAAALPVVQEIDTSKLPPLSSPRQPITEEAEESAITDSDAQPEASSSRSPSRVSLSSLTGAVDAGQDEGFDEFDDFDEGPGLAGSAALDGVGNGDGDGDAFGDFGDFEEGDFSAEEPSINAVEEQIPPPSQPERLPGLTLQPFPSRPDLISQLSTLLSPLLSPSSPLFTSEPPRLASSSRQILPTEAARDAYVQLASPPQLKPLDWTRSRVRREHLISMGVPVNLDEVDSHRLSTLPPLTISTNFASMRPVPGHVQRRSGSMEVDARQSSEGRVHGLVKGKGKEVDVISASPATMGPPSIIPGAKAAGGSGKYGLGVKPELDTAKAEELCGIEEDQLSLLSPAALKQIQDDLVQSSAQASALLAHLLQLKDALSQDSATYNGMISELIANAAKAKSAQQAGSGGVFRRASNRRPASMSANPGGGGGSGTATPRVGSPAIR